MAKIYALLDPEKNQVFYIGRTYDKLLIRLGVHLGQINSTNNSISNWRKIRYIDSLMQRGILPRVIKLEDADWDERAQFIGKHEREDYWIRHYISLGHPITNNSSIYNKNEAMIGLDSRTNKEVVRKYVTKTRLPGYVSPTNAEWEIMNREAETVRVIL